MCLGKMLDKAKNKGEKLPYLANVNVRWGFIELNNLRQMKFEEREAERYSLKYGDIVMCEGGEPGRCAIWKKQNSSMMIQKALHRIRAKNGVNSFFLYYALLNKGLKGHYKGYFTGAAIKHLTGKNLAKIDVDSPPLPIQQKIAGILSAYDDLIENNLKRIKLLEEMAQITYEEWFVRLRFPGHETTPVNAETGLPEGWERKKMSELCSKITDGTHDSPKGLDSGYKLITGKHIINGFLEFDTAYSISEQDHFKIKKRSGLTKGDILFSNIGTLGNAAIVTQDFDFSCKNVIIFKYKERKTNYLFTYLTNKNIQNKFFGQSSGVAQKFFSLKFIREYEDYFPPNNIIEQFDKFAGGIYKLKYQLNDQNQRLREARDILLPRLMTGMIDVESYTPAALLKEVA